MPNTSDNASARDILLRLGIGDFNATMCIPVMFMGPAQTDPDLTPVKIMTKRMQEIMQEMGATFVRVNHRIDQPTAQCLNALAGPHWAEHPWFELISGLLDARAAGKKFSMVGSPSGPTNPVELAGLGLLPSFSDIPGGAVTVGIGAFLLYRHFTKRKRSR